MQALRVQHTIQKSGQLTLKNLPVEKGQQVEVFVLFPSDAPRSHLTARQLLQSNLIGLWKDRDEIQDSSVYARELREKAQRRSGVNDDSAG
ncbi:MAG: hypothetical protein H6636_06590 [Anaerolineales bacterium]|nr:hypothetical protein [Anaerolineales bacterium]